MTTVQRLLQIIIVCSEQIATCQRPVLLEICESGEDRLHFSDAFVICAGFVLFREDTQNSSWQICILRHHQEQAHVLPNGRKDLRESIEQTAVRETHEETGYPCMLLPCTVTVRATYPRINMVDASHSVSAATELFAVMLRALESG
ncbi:hypothetical protein F5I97DRAFT_1901095 [Phlebopus sp. FC_14]|nr:hypothetical protein F5I97DRAFT_1901095 [Phlebopus sp. FC_14]